MSRLKLNHMQEVAVEMYCDWFRHPEKRKRPWFEISGAAGTGKTTVVKYIIQELGVDPDLVAYMAFVGKATLALRLNGLPARTIHSSIYNLEKVKKYREDGSSYKVEEFVKKKFLDLPYEQIVLDEGGMVGSELGYDILSYGVPLTVLGDLNQLPPVLARRMFLEAPDVTLNEIMRQEKDSPIIYLSQLATNGIPIKYGTYGDSECVVIHKEDITESHIQEADIIICGTNSYRDKVNAFIRKEILGIKEPRIVIGDKLICRQNKHKIMLDDTISLVNGLIGYVEHIEKNAKNKKSDMTIDFSPEFSRDKCFTDLPIENKFPFLPYQHRQEKMQAKHMMKGIAFELGHAITCHLAQGSQYDTVLVIAENPQNGLYFRQWLYTAITRAKKKLILAI